MEEQLNSSEGQQGLEEEQHERKWLHHHHRHMHDVCKRYQQYLVILEGNDGTRYEGIIQGVDDSHVYLLVPCGEEEDGDERQFGYPGYPYGYPYGYPSYGYPYGRYPRRFRRFRPYVFPFFTLRSLFFPFFY